MEREKHLVICWYCQVEFDLLSTHFCNHPEPTKICPFCLKCYCDASPEYKSKIFRESSLTLLAQKNDYIKNRDLKLGEILVNSNIITQDKLEKIIAKQKATKDKLGKLLIEEDLITKEELTIFLMEQKSIDSISLAKEIIDYNAVVILGKEKCIEKRIIPFELSIINEQKVLRFGIDSKENLLNLKLDKELKKYILIPYLLSDGDMLIALKKLRDFRPNLLILE